MRTTLAVIASAAFLASALPAAAGTDSIMLTPPDLGGSSSSSLDLPDAATTTFVVNLQFPGNFKKNSVAKVIVTYNSSETPCTARLTVGSLAVRARPGTQAIFGTPTAMGISNAAPISVTFTPLVLKRITHKVTGLTSGTVRGQRKGDLVSFAIGRLGSDAADICAGDVTVSGVEIRYLTP